MAYNRPLRIIVTGCVVRVPLGGMAWHYLQYVMGLARLGHDVHYIEDSSDYPSCYDPSRHTTGADPSFGVRFARATFSHFGLSRCWAYYDAHAKRWLGPASNRIDEICQRCELILNVSGSVPLRPWLMTIPRRAMIDTDPGFVQIRHLTDSSKKAAALLHNVFFTFGENLPARRSSIPDDGLPWQPTRQPVVLNAWKAGQGNAAGSFTTVMQWASDRPRCEYQGRLFGMKSDSFGAYVDLPRTAGAPFELAAGALGAKREELERMGWTVRNPLEITRTPWSYRDYIHGSKAEFSVAKHAYVVSRSGWFSERSACYLASGRPVVTQETGFSEIIGTGNGLLTFTTLGEALNSVEAVNRRYRHHCGEARSLAKHFFDAEKVLVDLVDRAMS